jgi:glyoxylase-like metal-dependent hydrolase (beta-lactamase superfamily II)
MEAPPKPWPTGLSEQCEPLVRRVLAPNASHYTYTGTQTYIVGAGAEVAVIDPGPADGGADSDPSPFKGADTNGKGHVEAILAAVGEARIAAILCTHTHRDHSPAAAVLKAVTGAPIIGCAPLVLSDDGPRADSAFDHSYAPDRVLADGEKLSGPDWTIEAVATPGHTSNHLCYAVLESGALFTGDHVMAWSTSVVSSPRWRYGGLYGQPAEALRARGQGALPGPRPGDHQTPATGPRHAGPSPPTRGADRAACWRAGPQAIPEFVAAMYKGLDPRLTGAAGRSVLAHLYDLRNRGMAHEDGATWRLSAA